MSQHGQWRSQVDTATLAEAIADVSTIPVADTDRIMVSMNVSNDSAVDQFVIQIKPHADAEFSTAFSLTADFTSPDGILIGTSGDLTAMAANSNGNFFVMDTKGIYQVRLRAAQAAGDASTLTIYTGGN